MFDQEKPEIQHIASIIISIIIPIIIIINLLIINLPKGQSQYIAEKGMLNLKDWKADEELNIKLDGEWEFYPKVLLKPKDIEKYEGVNTYINVPDSWEEYLNEDGSSDGSGTYRLIIKVPEDKIYGIKTKTIRSASRIYLNGEEIIHTGNPSTNKEKFQPDSKYKIGVGKSLNKEVQLIIHVSSYEYRTGGILKSIEFGSFESIMMSNNKDRTLDALIIAVCLILGIYFFIIYFQRIKESYLLYFSGTNIFMGIYLSTMNEQLLDLIHNYDFLDRIRIQILSIVMVTLCLLKFVHHFFIEYSNKKIANRLVIMMLFMLIVLFNNPIKKISIPMGIMQTIIFIGIAISYLYIFYILLKAIFNRAESLGYILIIATSLSSYWFIMGLKIFLEIDLGKNPIMLILVMMFGVAALMNHRIQWDYRRANSLSEKLIRYDRLKDELLAKASHELKTPLHIILNLTKNLLEGQKGTLNSSQQESLYFILQENQRLTRLVEDLFDAFQIKKDRLKLRMGPVKLYQTVEDILEEMKILIPRDKSIQLKNQIPKEFPVLEADQDKIRQILYNLVHNAVKYTDDGEIVISASTVDGQAEISVMDTGIGIDEKHFDEIFDTFYQNSKDGQIEQGLGLGLPIVKHLVESQGGEIYIDSIYGKGSNFKFTLKIFDGELEEDKSRLQREEIFRPITSSETFFKLEKIRIKDITNPTILVVDDEPLNQKILVDIIEELEINIILADNGKEAIDILETNKIDLIILDFILPDMLGDKVCKRIRQKYSMVELPILVLTASGSTMDLMDAFNYGANDFQRKPVDSEELISRIRSLLLMKKSVEDSLKKEFQYFYSQISPHFLYNTINTIIGLSYKDSEKARKALNNLSIYFRGKLDVHRRKGLIPLDSELELIKAYLEIEEMRYGEGLEIKYDIEEGLKAMIPPLTLQPIVENSIRHGIAKKNSKGIVKIMAKKEMEGFIHIIIEDNGIGMSFEKQRDILKGNNQRVGLNNVLEKIKILKGAKFALESKLDEGTRVEIIIPEVKYNESYFN